MPVKRISDINILQKGLFTAIYGNVNEAEFFVDNDLKKYSLWQQLYLYLKEQGYEMVLFYDTTNNFHAYSQSELINFLNLNLNTTNSTLNKEKYIAHHIKSPFRQQRINEYTNQKKNPPNKALEVSRVHFGSDKDLLLGLFGHPGNARYREF